ncbi:hypothetical protein ACTXIV_02580 [Psychrobacter celer]|uniref:hypothetical protein n=1 Tax=Psychrobacter celer TaxID=306572 RepID=UPI003FD23CFE
MKYFDIYLTVMIGDVAKDVVNRVEAEDRHHAIVAGFTDEVRNLSDDEVIEMLKGAEKELGKYEVDDHDTGIELDKVVELFEVPVMVNGREAVALLPDPTWNGMPYYKK